jgi:thiamine-phosphate diphosphorylase
LFSEVRLYVLITESCCRRPWLQAAEEVLRGGADCLQLREKSLDGGELLRRARDLVALCRRYNKLCIINDRPDIAILSGADGVHVGQDDLPATEVRKLIGPDKILGVSTDRIDQAKQAVLDGADYVGVGPIFKSGTKPRDLVAGLEYARQAASQIPIPAVAIAGITAANVDEVLATGIRAVAVTAAALDSDEPKGAIEALREKLQLTSTGWGRHSCLSPRQQVGQTFLSASDRRSESGGANIPICSEPKLEKTRRRLPHWRLDGSTYFVTFRVAQGELPPPERKIVLDHVKSGASCYYTLVAATIMPDHVHVLLTPRSGTDLSRILKGVKGVSARLLNQSRGTHGRVWQDESWDRIMRDQNELDEKLEYMLLNPVKKGLVEDPWEYDGWYYNDKWEQQLSQ